MIKFRDRSTRGRTQMGWLDSRHSFSFGGYHDPAHMGFGNLRVINDDRVAPGAGFGEHAHQSMEIITYVISGALAHQGSLGNGSVIRPGDVQRMSAGSGIRHSEFNHSETDPVHFYQIWVLPEADGGEPGYEQKTFPIADDPGVLRLVGDRDGTDGAVTIHQDIRLLAGRLSDDQSLTHEFADHRKAWLQVVRGILQLNGGELREGDGVAIQNEPHVSLCGSNGAELLLFEMP
ncbi:MAG: pirin family protein [Pseudomonadota bacterium]